MKRHIFIASTVLILTVLVAWSTGCKKNDNNNDFLIKVDSIVMPDTLSFQDTLYVKFYGMVGPDGCYKFDRFEQVPYETGDLPNSMKFKVWGKHEDSENCTQQIVYLDGREISITGLSKGNFFVFVIQPDGTVMSGVVYIKE